MKHCLSILLVVLPLALFSQTLQLHYDFRHTLDPVHNAMNFPAIYFEYFKQQDTSGTFFIKTESDLNGQDNNIGKFYTQIDKSVRFWRPKVYLQLQYSGGLGIAEPGSYAYYITNAFAVGAVYPFQWKKAWFSTSLSYNYNNFKRPSHDVLYSLYWGCGFWNYKIEFSGDVNIYTQNKNLGDVYTSNLTGKRVSFFCEPQLWFKVHNGFLAGTKINMYYHVLLSDDILQVYPTLGLRFKL